MHFVKLSGDSNERRTRHRHLWRHKQHVNTAFEILIQTNWLLGENLLKTSFKRTTPRRHIWRHQKLEPKTFLVLNSVERGDDGRSTASPSHTGLQKWTTKHTATAARSSSVISKRGPCFVRNRLTGQNDEEINWDRNKATCFKVGKE